MEEILEEVLEVMNLRMVEKVEMELLIVEQLVKEHIQKNKILGTKIVLNFCSQHFIFLQYRVLFMS